jgi:hypothetical protein
LETRKFSENDHLKMPHRGIELKLRALKRRRSGITKPFFNQPKNFGRCATQIDCAKDPPQPLRAAGYLESAHRIPVVSVGRILTLTFLTDSCVACAH